MNRITVGIDYRGGYRETIACLKQLGFSSAALSLVHGWGSRSASNTPDSAIGGILSDVLQREATNLMQMVHYEVEGSFAGISTVLSRDYSAEALVKDAINNKSQMIAMSPTVRSNSNRPFGATIYSVLDSAPCDVLIAREVLNRSSAKTALFIDDGSDESAIAYERFLSLKPSTIEDVVVITFVATTAARSDNSVINLETNLTPESKIKNATFANPERFDRAKQFPSGELVVSLLRSEKSDRVSILSTQLPTLLMKI